MIKKVKLKVYENLKNIQPSQSKVRKMCYKTIVIQEYMSSHVLKNHKVSSLFAFVSLLFALRPKTFRNVANYFGQDKTCSLGCAAPDIQERWTTWSITLENQGRDMQYTDIHGALLKQVPIVKLYAQLEQEREELAVREASSSLVADITGHRPSGPRYCL